MQRWCTRRGQAHGLLSSPPSFRQMKQHSSLHDISSLLRLVEVVAACAGGNLAEEGVAQDGPVTRRPMREEGVGVGIGAWTSVLPDIVA